ncbi:MAG: glycosyltransferase family 2 protein [Bacteroidales bacterium]|nr:glycosyltransferase family 2 protein [Bacteroidales bacterium]
MKTPALTIFTPTYNRANTLHRLFASLKRQTCKDFEWLVINDGSTDNTSELFAGWLNEDVGFTIKYYEVNNGGKNRALNLGIQKACGEYFMILDSDDLLTDDAVDFICQNMADVAANDSFIGTSGRKGDLNGMPLGVSKKEYTEEGYIDCSNLERSQYNLQRDMAEVFFTEKLRRYEFKVWEGEKFTPEEVVWNQMALDGYKLRWFNKVIYLCEYQQGGLSDSTWRLLRDNPMGYAMMFNQRLLIENYLKGRLRNALQYGSCCILAKKPSMVFKSHTPFLTALVSPISWMLAARRRTQFKKYSGDKK